jgi:hypothetical protein
VKIKTVKYLEETWQTMEDIFPDKSTEFLLEVTAQEASRKLGHHFDCGDIAEAITKEQDHP